MTRSLAVIALLAATLAACGDDSTAPSSTPVPGTYVLIKANGHALPDTSVMTGSVTILKADTLFIGSGVTFSDHEWGTADNGSGVMVPASVVNNGLYQHGDYNTFAFNDSTDAPIYFSSGTILNGVATLTVYDSLGGVFDGVYKRQ